MEFLTNFFNITILPFILAYATTFIAAVAIGLMIAFFAVLIMLTKPIIGYLKSLAEKNLSEKVSHRINDALVKLENVLIDMLSLQQNTVKRLAEEAYKNDGKIDMTEVMNIAKEVSKIALTRLSPEVATIQKYLAGDAVVDYIQDKVAAIITQSVEKFLNEKLLNGKK